VVQMIDQGFAAAKVFGKALFLLDRYFLQRPTTERGASIKLKTLFTTRASLFQCATVSLYDKEETIEYLCLDLLWGQQFYQELRFVLVKYKDSKYILGMFAHNPHLSIMQILTFKQEITEFVSDLSAF